MNKKLKELINYRFQRSKETYQEAILKFDNKHFNACVNRLYYCCFYLATAVLATKGIHAKFHSGVKG